MAFENITLFEFDLEDAQFGPRDLDVPDRVKGKVGSSDEPAVEAKVETEDESGGMGVGRMIVMGLVFSIAAVLIARRFRGGEDGETGTSIEFEEDEEVAEVGP